MKVLAIETSCDETAVALLECAGDEQSATFRVLSHALLSQIEIHREFGGVFPAVAKREHAKNLVPLLQGALEEAEMLGNYQGETSINQGLTLMDDEVRTRIGTLLEREPDMTEAFFDFITETERPDIDAIAVTYGPGLAPALWVGVNFAQALALAWNMPLVPVNHMEGHFMVALAKTSDDETFEISDVALPVLGLLISGGHTEIDLMEEWLSYRRLGETRDDAVGEAFDKVARMLGLPYPGGPEISRLAEKVREDKQNHRGETSIKKLPRPMIDQPGYDFSFSGLKTSVLYQLKAISGDQSSLSDPSKISDTVKEHMAFEFEEAVSDVLVSKVAGALEETQAQTLAIGGGVSANAHIRKRFEKLIAEKFPYVDLRLPPAGLTGDNAVMIGVAGYYRARANETVEPGSLIADGNLSLAPSSPQ
jgi:N6-L-threonylcarbamoyladenine synthase